MIAARAVILAAGTSARMGRQKLLMNYGDRCLIEYPIAAAQAWQPVVVCGTDVARYLQDRSDLEVIFNADPARGMSHSLALANRAIAGELRLIVLLGDQPRVSESLIRHVLANARGADFAYPEYEGVPGHPVVFSQRARTRIEGLPSGDSLRRLRQDRGLTVRAIATADSGATFDVNVEEELT